MSHEAAPESLNRKYEFTGQTREFAGRTLRQIRALRPLELSAVAAGEVGGWIEQESNLSHGGECWVYPEAAILEDAVVEGDCRIADRAVVRGRARLRDFVLMFHDSEVTDDAVVQQTCRLSGDTLIYGQAVISCGQDGPWIQPGVQIDFDVSYGQRYVTFGTAYNGYLVAISSSGRICIAAAPNGGPGSGRWAGSREALPAWAAQQTGDDPEVAQVQRFVAFHFDSYGN